MFDSTSTIVTSIGARVVLIAFHRTGRADLGRFMGEDVPVLYRHLSARTKHVFNLRKSQEYGAFYNLVQHHRYRYPTPLLDWTYSPFVAAFFAFQRISNSKARAQPDNKVRIFVFDKAEWMKQRQLQKLINVPPHFSMLEALAIENERMIPQQALSTLTNVDDIETYLSKVENLLGKVFLQVVDLPWRECPDIMRELAVMGITAGSPGR